ncbi:multifunctional protein ADE2-like [Branchiostoma floridae]|uniref:Multifunctional protein ADE2-like n=1 Tax=Branchiostoma floridae TaxID=7739 RepID=A0A9J7MU56_BRAFL|nr:multifunctional protein ADE2-like [Branchiostoma floridae]
MAGLKLGDKIIEGKTKIVYALPDDPANVYILSKDRITAGDGARANDLEGKAVISTATATSIFHLLTSAGIKNHFVRQHDDKSFIAQRCDMIPIEWVTRRLATGSFLKRNVGVKEGYRFSPPKLETFFKDDENHDPQWSYEQLLGAKLEAGGRVIGRDEVEIMSRTTVAVFEVLEKAWATQNCTLVDMKIEFGVNTKGEIVLADLIDSDSWRLWPSGDRRLMKDKQVYRELKEVTAEALDEVKRNFQWVAERVKLLQTKPSAQVVVLMGSATDLEHGQKISKGCQALGIPCDVRVSSAHKGTNGLGPVLSGNTSYPVINCPPVKADWGAQDIWSSLRLPSGLGCSTVLSPDAAVLAAAQILSLSDHMIWSRLRCKQLYTYLGLKDSDKEVRKDK